MEKKPFSGMYVHIPFCIAKCRYCSFVSVPVCTSGDERINRYVQVLFREMEKDRPSWSEERFDSLFFGGGTPSVLPSSLIVSLIQKAFGLYRFEEDSEVSIECNPESFTPQKAYDYREAGVSRISFGVQSANNGELRMLGRPHTFTDAQNAIDYARAAGFINLNADLIYGLPGQTLTGFLQTARKVLDLGVEHLSCYALSVEEGTKLFDDVASGKLTKPDEDVQAEMFERIGTLAAQYGFIRYEISNYARPGFECRHNLHYWHQHGYAGFGVAAHGAKMGNHSMLRIANAPDLEHYLQCGPERSFETVDGQDAMFEYVMLATRLTEGVELDDFFGRYGVRFEQIYRDAIQKSLEMGLAALSDSRFTLSEKGLLLQNSVLQWFMP